MTSALGHGNSKTLHALENGISGLHYNDLKAELSSLPAQTKLMPLQHKADFADQPNAIDLQTYIGRVKDVEDIVLPEHLTRYHCRNNQLALLTLQQDNFIEAVKQAKKTYGKERIGVFLGTSTSGINETEKIYRSHIKQQQPFPSNYYYRETHDNFSLADFVRRYLDIKGPAFVVSTACSSSAKVFADAYRFIHAGFCDAAIVGGVDSLCLTTLYGFNSLELVSSQPCKPADQNRNGISLGEAGGFALLEKMQASSPASVCLAGYGESSDAYHMATPNPTGKGMAKAIQLALHRANLNATDINYINLHGTATKTNDLAEDKAIISTLGNAIPCSSSKGWTGHTLGAAGITEAVISAICLQRQFLPKSLNTETIDPNIQSDILRHNLSKKVNYILSNSFGFGGNNCSLILGNLT